MANISSDSKKTEAFLFTFKSKYGIVLERMSVRYKKDVKKL